MCVCVCINIYICVCVCVNVCICTLTIFEYYREYFWGILWNSLYHILLGNLRCGCMTQLVNHSSAVCVLSLEMPFLILAWLKRMLQKNYI